MDEGLSANTLLQGGTKLCIENDEKLLCPNRVGLDVASAPMAPAPPPVEKGVLPGGGPLKAVLPAVSEDVATGFELTEEGLGVFGKSEGEIDVLDCAVKVSE
jgi:hypothetical protein